MYLVIDLETGVVSDRTASHRHALKRANLLTEAFAWVNGHEFGVVLA